MYVIYTAVLRAVLPCSRTKILIIRAALNDLPDFHIRQRLWQLKRFRIQHCWSSTTRRQVCCSKWLKEIPGAELGNPENPGIYFHTEIPFPGH